MVLWTVIIFPVFLMAAIVVAKSRVIILPGNGCSPVNNANWYASLRSQILKKQSDFSECLLRDMPDPDEAYESSWIPFILNELKVDENTIVIGHSSGAQAAMRLLEAHKVKGCVLVSACVTDGGMESERISGYYSRPWEWAKIRSNAEFILQYHSSDDPFIPRSEADEVATQLQAAQVCDGPAAKVTYTCFDDRSHFFDSESIRHILPDIRRELGLL